MIKEDRLKIMTGIAMYRKKEGKASGCSSAFFKNDYIQVQLLRTFFLYTASFCIGAALCALCFQEEILDITELDRFKSILLWTLAAYAVGLALFQLVTIVRAVREYNEDHRRQRLLAARQKRLKNKMQNVKKEG